MIQNSEPYLNTAGGKIRCRRCKAQSSRTKVQCSKPALKGKAVCGHHGGYSTGPKTKEGKDRIRAAHLKHGKQTLRAKAKRSEKSALILYLIDIAASLGMLNKTHPVGRKPKNYKRYNMNDPEQITLAILETRQESNY